MIRLEMKNCNAILTEKQEKYQHCHLKKFININNLLSDQRRVIEQAKVTYSSLGKALEKQAKTVKNQWKKASKSNWRLWKTVSWM